MLAKWLLPSLRGFLGERNEEHKEATHDRKSERLARKISRLDVKAAKMDYMAAKCQYKSQHKILPWRQKKWQKRADKLFRKVSKLQEMSRSQDCTQIDDRQPELAATGTWVKDRQQDINILPPRYEEICVQYQPPPYEEDRVTEKTSLYPTLM